MYRNQLDIWLPSEQEREICRETRINIQRCKGMVQNKLSCAIEAYAELTRFYKYFWKERQTNKKGYTEEPSLQMCEGGSITKHLNIAPVYDSIYLLK